MSSFCTDTSTKSRTPLVDRIVNDALFQTVPHLNQTTLQIVNISHLRLVNTFLHRTPHFVIHNVEKILKIGQYLPKICMGKSIEVPFLTQTV